MLTRARKPHAVQVPAELNPDTIRALENSVDQLIADGVGTIVLDCTKLAHISSMHIGVIWSIHSRCDNLGVGVILNSVSQTLSRVLRILDLDKLLEINESVAASEKSSHLSQAGREAIAEFQARCKTDEESVAAVNDSFREYIRSLELEKHQAIDLETVFYEVITNIKNHADVTPGEYITVSARFNEQQLVLNFADPGMPFDPTRQRGSFNVVESLEIGQKNGFGLTMISRMTDKIEYSRSKDGVNLLSLTKLLAKDNNSV
jgi:anti-anti-sigma factor